MKVLIAGSRHWLDAARISADIRALLREHGEALTVVHGGAPRGADRLADVTARSLGIRVIVVPAHWSLHDREGATPVQCWCAVGKQTCNLAGRRRNQAMLDVHHPDLVLAYRASGTSNGTDDMVRRARVAGVEVRVVREQQELGT